MNAQTLRNSTGAALVCLVLFSCSKNDNSGYGSNNNPPGSPGNAVSITGMRFDASSLTVKTGTTIIWTNYDNATHTVTADDASFTSGDLKKGDKYSRTFSSTGTFSYHCKYHATMTGSIIVSQ